MNVRAAELVVVDGGSRQNEQKSGTSNRQQSQRTCGCDVVPNFDSATSFNKIRKELSVSPAKSRVKFRHEIAMMQTGALGQQVK